MTDKEIILLTIVGVISLLYVKWIRAVFFWIIKIGIVSLAISFAIEKLGTTNCLLFLILFALCNQGVRD